jgi:hypothetical protein
MKPMTCLGLAGFTIVCSSRGPIGHCRHNSHENCKLRNGTLTGRREDWQDSLGRLLGVDGGGGMECSG